MTDPHDSDNATWCQKWLDRSEQHGWPAFHCNPLRSLTSATQTNGRSGEGASSSSASYRECPAKARSGRSAPCYTASARNPSITSTNISEADRGRYAQVLGKMDEFFKVQKNVIFERASFNLRTQRQGETAEEFITSIYILAADCQYGNLRDKMIRDRLVVGESSTRPCLKKAKQIVRQREAVQKQQTILHRGEQPSETMVSYLKGDKRSSSKKSSTPPQRQQRQHSQKCTRCGKGPHSRGACPAKEAICHKCKKKGHYSAQYFSKGVAEVSSQPISNLDITYLNTIGSGSHASWKATVKVNNQMMTFKLDTGAEVTALTEPAFLQLRDVPQ